MPKFAVGDRVERIGAVVPESMRIGTVTHVVRDTVGLDTFYEYEVKFVVWLLSPDANMCVIKGIGNWFSARVDFAC